MSDLSRLVWRNKSGYLLGEIVRDRFLGESERLRGRMRVLADRLLTWGQAHTPAGKIERAFDVSLRAAERSARLNLFDESLAEILNAERAADITEQICAACVAIESAETELALVERSAKGLEFSGVDDFRIMVNRSRALFAEEEFRAAGFIADEAVHGLKSLTAVAPEGRPCPAHIGEAAARQEELALALAALNVGSKEAVLVQTGTEAVRQCIGERRFDLAAKLLGDLEAEFAAPQTFLSQENLAERMGMNECVVQALALLREPEERTDAVWREATALLVESSLTETSRHTRQKALAEAGNQ